MSEPRRPQRLVRNPVPDPKSWAGIAFATLLILFLTPASVRSTNKVDLVLVLALDVSGSVNDQEYKLQKNGLVRAFRHPSVIEAISQGHSKRIAVTAVQWAGFREQVISVPWTVIAGPNAAAEFADRLAEMRRRYAYPLGVTHISGIIRFGTEIALAAPYTSDRRVVDISGDGKNNVNESPETARDEAVVSGLTINGLAIINETPDLTSYYRETVIGGPGAFVITANDYDDYARSILRKLIREISHHLIM
ncbi:MAG: DUF1194 domain-containing protein [Methyloligellaceae bacterium]